MWGPPFPQDIHLTKELCLPNYSGRGRFAPCGLPQSPPPPPPPWFGPNPKPPPKLGFMPWNPVKEVSNRTVFGCIKAIVTRTVRTWKGKSGDGWVMGVVVVVIAASHCHAIMVAHVHRLCIGQLSHMPCCQASIFICSRISSYGWRRLMWDRIDIHRAGHSALPTLLMSDDSWG